VFGVTLLAVVAAPALVYVLGAGFAQIPGKVQTTALLLRIVFPYIFFVSLTVVFSAALNNYGRFVPGAFAPVLLNVATASPGLFSADGSGFGQGYILNKDGTPNSPANPAATGDKITVYATGVGPVSFTNGYAVTEFPADLYIDGFHCDGLAAVMGSVAGFPGAVYQLTVLVPNPAAMVATNPNLLNFTFPPQVPVVLQIDGATTQTGLAISIAQ